MPESTGQLPIIIRRSVKYKSGSGKIKTLTDLPKPFPLGEGGDADQKQNTAMRCGFPKGIVSRCCIPGHCRSCPRRLADACQEWKPRALPLRLQDLPVCGIVKIEACTVVCVHPVRAGAVGEIAPERQVGFVQLGGVGGGLCHGHDMAGAEEKQNLVQRTADVVMPGREKLLVEVVCAAQVEQFHRFGQVDRPADGVLGIDRGDHQPLAQKQLVFHLCGVGVGGEIEGQRAEVGAILQRGFHELAVQVGQERVAQLQHFAEGGHFCTELVVFLIPGAGAGMVAHQRGKEAEFQPAQSQIGRGVAVKAAEIRPGVEETAGTDHSDHTLPKIRPGVEETAHLDVGHHLDVGQKLRPRGVVVAQPDAAVPVGADEAGAAVQQGALVGA